MRAIERPGRATLARLGLTRLLAIAAVLLLHLMRGTTLWFDKCVWALDRRGSSLGTFLEPGVTAELQVTIPPGLLLRAMRGPANLSLRRFASTFPEEPLATLSASGVVRIDRDHAREPWHFRVAPQASAEACGLA